MARLSTMNCLSNACWKPRSRWQPQKPTALQPLSAYSIWPRHWLSVGAQPTATVVRLLKRRGIQPVEVRGRVKAAAQAAKKPAK